MTAPKFRGCHLTKDGGWSVSIGKGGKQVYLGYFSSFEDAKKARLDGELSLFGAHFDASGAKIIANCDRGRKVGRKGKCSLWKETE